MNRAIRSLAGLLVCTLALCVGASPAHGQVALRDFVLTGGLSVESYQGRLPALTVPIVDSTDRAGAAVGQFSGSGTLVLHSTSRAGLTMAMDAGLRQFAAQGFEVRDYSPRELVGSMDVRYRRQLGGLGTLDAVARLKGRRVDDRPPMPLFIEPGYGSVRGTARLELLPLNGVRFDAELSGETVNYTPPQVAPHLDLLDRRLLAAEAGAEWGGEEYSIRFHAGYSSVRYPEQRSFDPRDPFRGDDAVRVGARLTVDRVLFARLGVEGTLNRSNSRRPEYNALSATALLQAPLPAEFNLQFFAMLTGKSYLHRSPFARLVPGEEADNASVAFVSLSHPLTPALDGALRVGWTRAETEIGNAYFQRYGATFFLHYRPGRR
ncbi:MAG: hypothetical protein HY704_03280 [Gemmatimonadetes bacterium]|nr:hypothetical protein [Gemmatimonadota bacterium]